MEKEKRTIIEQAVAEAPDAHLDNRILFIKDKIYSGKTGTFAYLIVYAGDMTVLIDGESHRLKAGDLAILSPSQVLEWKKGSALTELLLVDEDIYQVAVFRNKFYYQYLIYKRPVWHLSPDEHFMLCECMKLIRAEIEDYDNYYRKTLVQTAVFMFLLELINLFRHKQEVRITTKQDQVFRDFAELVVAHFQSEHNIDFYAEQMNMSPQNLSLLIKKVTGNTATDFIYDMLYQQARVMLHNPTISIAEIADKLHFSDQSAFGKFFKSKSGLTPAQFREQHLL